jgi:hypothetical protein
MLPDLRQLVPAHQAIVDRIREMYPEATEDDLLDTIEGESNLQDAIIAVMRHAIEREATGKALGDLIDRMTARKRRLEEGARSLRSAALQAMQESGLKKLPAPDFSLSVGQTKPKIIITDDKAVPDHFCKIERSPSKTMIADEFAAGRDVPGATRGNSTPFLTVHTR